MQVALADFYQSNDTRNITLSTITPDLAQASKERHAEDTANLKTEFERVQVVLADFYQIG